METDKQWAKSWVEEWAKQMGPFPNPETVRLGDLIDAFEEYGYDMQHVRSQVTDEMLDAEVYPISLGEVESKVGSPLEMSIQFKVVE